MKNIKGFEGEVKRYAGDASKQLAEQFAEKAGGVVITSEDMKFKGIRPCYVVLKDYQTYLDVSIAFDDSEFASPIEAVYFSTAAKNTIDQKTKKFQARS